MNVEPRQSVPPSLPTAFVETFDGLLAGAVSLDFTRRHLVATIEQNAGCVGALQVLIDQAYEETRLSDEDYEVLNNELSHLTSEDVPTDWSDEVASGVRPGPAQVDAGSAGLQADALTRQLERAANPLYPGAVLRERFVLQARVAAGGMADVYKALDRRRQEAGLGNPYVAIKVVNPAFPHHDRGVASLQHEASLAPRLQHPCIGHVLDFDRDGEHAFLTMEWLQGESLADLLTRLRYRPVPTGRARQIIEHIGAALVYAHGHGIVHGDVKPGNIVLATDGTAKLVDFGAAREIALAAASPSGQVTPPYASCEILEGQAPTRQDDLYSLACVAYRMLAGRRAFARLAALEAERVGRRPARIAHATSAQWAAIERALSFRREGRHSDINAFLLDFSGAGTAAAAAEAAAGEARTTPAPIVAWPSMGARPALLATAAASFAVALGLAMLWRGGAPASAPVAATPAATAPLLADRQPPPASGAAGATEIAPPARQHPAPAEAPETRPDSPRRMKPRDSTPAPRGPARTAVTAAASRPAPAVGPPTAELVGAGAPAALTAAPPAPAPAAAAAPREVALSELKFSRFVEPDYRGAGGERGSVLVRFRVAEDGRTADATVVESEPAGRFDAAALAAVRRWRFYPATEQGRPVARRSSVRLRFQP